MDYLDFGTEDTDYVFDLSLLESATELNAGDTIDPGLVTVSVGTLTYSDSFNLALPDDYNGEVVITYAVLDSSSQVKSYESRSIFINAVNDAPVFSSDGGGATATVTINEGTTAVTTVAASDVDIGRFLTAFEGESLNPAVHLDIPNPSVANITFDAANDRLDFSAAAATDMWSSRNNVPIAWLDSPEVALGESWAIETKVHINDFDQLFQVAGIAFYADTDGATPQLTFGLENWGSKIVHAQGLGDDIPNISESVSSSDLYLRVEVTENGSNDDYAFYYKANEGDDWTWLGSADETAPNARAGLFYKTNGAADGASFSYVAVDGVADQVTYAITGGADASLFTVDTYTGALSFIAAPDYENPADVGGQNAYEVEVTASDGHGGADIQTLNVAVANVNELPTGAPTGTVADGTEDVGQLILSADLLAGFSDPDGDTLSVSAISAEHGTLSATTGGWTFTPEADYNGIVTLTYTVSDGQGGTLTGQTLSFSLASVNDAPVATGASHNLLEDVPFASQVSGSDVENDPLTYAVVDGPQHGQLDFNPDGSYVYTPGAEYSGVDNFTYRANDGTDDGGIATVAFTVFPVNDPPSASGSSETVDEDSVLTSSVSVTDADNDVLSYTVGAGPQHGTLDLREDGTYTYTPEANYHGSDSFTFTASDAQYTTNQATVSITVNSVDDGPPVLSGPPAVLADGPVDSEYLVTVAQLQQGATDPDGDMLGIDNLTADHGTIRKVDSQTLAVVPDAGYVGLVTLSYALVDSDGSSLSRTLSFNLVADNTPPTASGSSESLLEDIPLSGMVSGTDADNDDLTFTLDTGPSHGTLDFNADGTYLYTPDANYFGQDSFTFTANDGTDDSGPATVILNVVAVNDPVAGAPSGSIANGTEDTAQFIAESDLLAGFSDADGDTLSVSSISADHGTLTATAGGWTFTPAANYNGTVTLSYAVSDGNGSIVTGQTRSFELESVNDAPVAIDDSASLNEDGVLTSSVAATDEDNDDLTYAVASGPAHGTLDFNEDGTYTYTPDANFNGADGFTFTANDGTTHSESGTVTLTVLPVSETTIPLVGGMETRVNATTAYNQTYSSVAGLAGGGYVVTWQSYLQDGSNWGIYAQRFDAAGNAVGAETRVNTTTDQWQYWPEVTALASGGYVITWIDPLADGSGRGIFVQRYDAAGGPVGGQTRVNTYTTGEQQNPSITTLADDGYVVVWQSSQDGSGWSLHAQLYNASGGAVGGETAINSFTTGDQSDATVAGLAGGGYVITWQSNGQDGSGQGVYARRYDATGTATGGEFRVNATTSGDQQLPMIAALQDGGYVIAWQSNGQDGSGQGIYLQRYDSANNTVGGEIPVNTYTALDQSYAAITALQDGGFVVTWQSFGQDGSDWGIYAQRYDADSVAVGGEFRVNSVSASYQMYPDVSTLADGALVFTFQGPDGSDEGIYQRIFRENGVVTGAPTVTLDDGDEDTPQFIAEADLLEGFSDPDGNEHLRVSAIAADYGTLLETDGGWTFTPEADYYGVVTITYTVSDGQGSDLSGQTRSFTLAPVNEAPTGEPQGTVEDGTEDTPQVVAEADLLSGFSDADGDTLSVSAISADHGTLTVTTGGWTFTPEANYNGTVTLTYTVSDGQGGTLPNQTRSFELESVNDAPTGTPPVLPAGTEDVTYTVTGAQLRAGFTDVDGDAVSITGLTAEYSQGYVGGTVNTYGNRYFTTNDSIALAGGGSVFMFRGYNNGYVYHVVVNDADGATVNDLHLNDDVNLIALNDGSFVALSVRNYDNYTRNTATHYSAAGTVIDSTVDVSTIGYTYKGRPTGVALSDGGYLLSWTEQALSGNTYQAYARAYNADGTPQGALITLGVSSASSTNVSNLFLSAHDDGSFVAVWQEFGNATSGNRWDVYSQRFAADGTALGSAYRVNTTTVGEQEGPSVSVLDGGGYVIAWRDFSATKFMVYDASGNAIGGEHTITGSANPITNYGQGTLRPEVVGLSDGGFVIATGYPDASGKGVAIVRYDAIGNQLGSPVFVPADQTGDQVTSQISLRSDGSLLLVWDEGGVVKTRVFAEGTSGDATVTYDAGTDTYSITRPADFNGLLKINYTVSDGNGGDLPASSTISINAVNDAPRGTPTGTVADGTEDTTQFISAATLLEGFSDVDGNTLSISSISSNHGSLTTTTGGWTFTPAANYNGSVTLTYTVSDGQGGMVANQTRSFALTSVNDLPLLTAAKATVTGTEDIGLTLTAAQLKQGYSDADGDTLGISGVTADHGSITDNGDGTWSLAPEADYNGTVVISYTLSDGNGGTLDTTLNVAVAPVNDIPTGSPTGDLAGGTEDVAQFIAAADLLAGFSDADGGTLNVSTISADHGALTATAGGWTLTPEANYHGKVTLTYTVSDGQGGTLPGQQLALTLVSVNDAPALTGSRAVLANGSEDIGYAITGAQLIAGWTDVESDALSVPNLSADHATAIYDADTDTWTLVPDPDYFGVVVVTYTVTDGMDGVVTSLKFTLDQVIDTITASISTTLADGQENLSLTGRDDIDGTGNSLDNRIIGNPGDNHLYGYAGNDLLYGGPGADTLYGGSGDDTYSVDNINDLVSEETVPGTDDGGYDTVASFISWTLGDHIEVLALNGDGDTNGTGNALDNRIVGNAGNNRLDGGAGADTMIGQAGNDTYVVDNPEDKVIEQPGQGHDTVISTLNYALGNNLEDLVLEGSDDLTGTGNALNNRIVGNTGSNWLNGSAGADMMFGGAGSDTYIVDNIADSASEETTPGSDDGGVDLVNSSVSFTLGAFIENLYLRGSGNINGTGNATANRITGNAGANLLDGGEGADQLYGGAGNDTYVVDDAGDIVGEAPSAGIDTVLSSVSYGLSGNVEILQLTGTADLTARGNNLNNTLIGNAGNNVLNGSAGADKMYGGAGNDTYIVDNAGDLVSEEGVPGLDDGGVDVVNSSVSYVLGAHIERLVLSGAGNIGGTGNALDNSIAGNSGNNRLDGGAGSDRLTGGLGADTFVYSTGNDIITDFSAAQGDMIDLHALTGGVENLNMLSQQGARTIIDLGDGNTLTVLNTVHDDPGFLSHIIW